MAGLADELPGAFAEPFFKFSVAHLVAAFQVLQVKSRGGIFHEAAEQFFPFPQFLLRFHALGDVEIGGLDRGFAFPGNKSGYMIDPDQCAVLFYSFEIVMAGNLFPFLAGLVN